MKFLFSFLWNEQNSYACRKRRTEHCPSGSHQLLHFSACCRKSRCQIWIPDAWHHFECLRLHLNSKHIFFFKGYPFPKKLRIHASKTIFLKTATLFRSVVVVNVSSWFGRVVIDTVTEVDKITNSRLLTHRWVHTITDLTFTSYTPNVIEGRFFSCSIQWPSWFLSSANHVEKQAMQRDPPFV